MTNAHHHVLYIGVTAELWDRVYAHKNKVDPDGFTAKYNVDKLVYYVFLPSIEEAIELEKRMKKLSRERKMLLVTEFNPEWRELERED